MSFNFVPVVCTDVNYPHSAKHDGSKADTFVPMFMSVRFFLSTSASVRDDTTSSSAMLLLNIICFLASIFKFLNLPDAEARDERVVFNYNAGDGSGAGGTGFSFSSQVASTVVLLSIL